MTLIVFLGSVGNAAHGSQKRCRSAKEESGRTSHDHCRGTKSDPINAVRSHFNYKNIYIRLRNLFSTNGTTRYNFTFVVLMSVSLI